MMASDRATDRAYIEEIYPVLTLPNELISEIFLHVIPAYPRSPPRYGRRSPTLLTHICRQWREIALATPALWRAILLDGSIPSGEHIRFLASWLSRSGRFPLSIQMTDDFAELTPEELDVILPYRARWEHLRLHIDFYQLLPLEGPMPLVRDLEIRVPRVTIPPFPISYRQLPQLRSATLWDFDYPSGFLPWSQLTSLTLVCKSTSQCTAVLAETLQLVHCTLVIYTDSGPQLDTKLAHWESLVLIKFVSDSDRPTAYLDTFILPALRRLQIPDEFRSPGPVTALGSFISKSECKLQNVHITGKRTASKSSYRMVFPSIRKVSFDEMLTGWLELEDERDSWVGYRPDSSSIEISSDSE
ncbi:hypothetical protein B0H17DRAFT_1336225 [Mycena rosella]|uniref:F-box domain-containing protein n=1 Tax=Mycena rosella TaxID=1033263 RepID=A0AAD7CVZ2_MYCRO|nr:hypothetical protein B0H17DRAFT_1336225 [Mycena rosella]